MCGVHVCVFIHACMYNNLSVMVKALSASVHVCMCVCADALMLCFVWRHIRGKVQRPPGGSVPQRNKGTTAPQINVVSGGRRSRVRWNNIPSLWLAYTHPRWVWSDVLPVYQTGSSYSTLVYAAWDLRSHNLNGCFEQKESLTACDEQQFGNDIILYIIYMYFIYSLEKHGSSVGSE